MITINSSGDNVPGSWGDFVGKIWAAEYIKSVHPDYEILFDDDYPIGGRLSDSMKLPWATVTKKLAGEYQISTHHRHWWASRLTNPDYGKFIYFDAHGLIAKMIHEDWYPTFEPTDRLLEEFDKLNLPDIYDVVHINATDPRWQRVNYDQELNLDLHENYISTNHNLGDERNLANIDPWLKMYVLIKARKLFCSHSGYPSMAAIWRKRKESYLVGYNYPRTIFQGPPALSYGNAHFETDNYTKLYYYADKFVDWNHYMNFLTDSKRKEDWINTSQYEGLDFYDWDKINVPIDYKPQKVSLVRENCLLPQDTLFGVDKHPLRTIVPNDVVVWGGMNAGSSL